MGSACSEANAKREEKRCVVVGPSSVKKWTAHNLTICNLQISNLTISKSANLILDLISMCILAQSGGTCTENK